MYQIRTITLLFRQGGGTIGGAITHTRHTRRATRRQTDKCERRTDSEFPVEGRKRREEQEGSEKTGKVDSRAFLGKNAKDRRGYEEWLLIGAIGVSRGGGARVEGKDTAVGDWRNR